MGSPGALPNIMEGGLTILQYMIALTWCLIFSLQFCDVAQVVIIHKYI
jgi:hypothetical protein